MKKILIVLLSFFLLTSCGKKSENTETTNTKKVGLRYYPGNDFSLNIPSAWNNITSNKEILPNPKNGKVELALTSSETKNGFANNLIILSQELEKNISSKDYSIINNVGAEGGYLNYFKKSEKEFTFLDGNKSILYFFQAKYAEDTPLLNFIQTANVCKNDKAFLLTIALPLEIKNISKYEKILSSFKCK